MGMLGGWERNPRGEVPSSSLKVPWHSELTVAHWWHTHGQIFTRKRKTLQKKDIDKPLNVLLLLIVIYCDFIL